MENNTNSFDEQKKKKLTLLTVAMLVCIVACIIVAGTMFGVTLARYVTGEKSADTSLPVAKWGVDTKIAGNLTVVGNDYVVDGKLAPATEAYIDVEIQLAGTEVAVDYKVEIGNITGTNVPTGLALKKVVPVGTDGSEGTELTGTGNVYSGIIPLNKDEDNKTTAFGADDKFIIRIYFEWTNSDANDATDTAIGQNAPGDLQFNIKVSAQQHIPADD